MSTPISTDLVALALEQTATSRRKRDERGMTTAEYTVVRSLYPGTYTSSCDSCCAVSTHIPRHGG